MCARPLKLKEIGLVSKKLKLGYCNKDTFLFTIYPYNGNLIHVRAKPSGYSNQKTSMVFQAYGIFKANTATILRELVNLHVGAKLETLSTTCHVCSLKHCRKPLLLKVHKPHKLYAEGILLKSASELRSLNTHLDPPI